MRNSGTENKAPFPACNALLERWNGILADSRDKPAIYSPDREVLRSFSDIEAEAGDLARKLAVFPPGSVIGLQLGNGPAWPAALLACFRLGLVALPLGDGLGVSGRAAALGACGASGYVDFRFSIFDIREQSASGPLSDRIVEFMKLTSGTTAAPRAICFRASQLVADCDNICETMGIGPDDVNFGVIPFSHSYGFSNLVTPLLCRGVRLVASEDRMPRAILNDLSRSGSTVFAGMPVFYQAMAGLDDPPALGDLRLCISAGAPLMSAVGEAFTSRFGLKIHTFYGSSECGGIGYDRSDGGGYEEGFAGTAMENVSIEPIDAGETSRIRVRSQAVGEGYFPEPDGETLGNGSFIPGDLVTVTPRGMFLAGRVSDVINVAGRKLNPMEVEARVAACPGVRQVVVFGVPSALRHEDAVACVVGEAGLEQEALVRHCRSVLSAWQVPRDIWMVPEIPVNDRGKVSRRDLARQYLANKK